MADIDNVEVYESTVLVGSVTGGIAAIEVYESAVLVGSVTGGIDTIQVYESTAFVGEVVGDAAAGPRERYYLPLLRSPHPWASSRRPAW